jgi:polyisoprenoid-binding protein YceI
MKLDHRVVGMKEEWIMKKAGIVEIVSTVVLALWMSSPALAAMERYNVDPDHSIIGFSVAHMMVSKTTGRFTDYTGFVEMDPEAKTVKTIEAVIKTASVDTNHAKRDGHLKSPDFFDVDKFPTMTYKMKSYEKKGDQYLAKGDLTLRGITKEIVLTGTFHGVIQKDLAGMTRAGFSAEGKINRKDFGMIWNKALDNGGIAVGDEVDIKLEIEAIKEQKAQHTGK